LRFFKTSTASFPESSAIFSLDSLDEVSSNLTHLTLPATSNFSDGSVVPMPTLPVFLSASKSVVLVPSPQINLVSPVSFP
jgi:hypothetical protein